MSTSVAVPVYDKDSIQSIDPMDHVRLRAGMYIGSLDEDGLHHMLNEVIDNSVDEYIMGHGKSIKVTLHTSPNDQPDKIVVSDSGRGIPVGYRDDLKCDIFTAIFSKTLTGGKFGGNSYNTSSGMNGIGVKCVNALSSFFEAVTWTLDKMYIQEYSAGKEVTGIQELDGNYTQTGTQITFIPDTTILRVGKFNVDRIKEKLSSVASILPGIKITLFVDGECELDLCETEKFKLIHENALPEKSLCDFTIDVPNLTMRLSYHPTLLSSIKSFVNTVPTVDQGSHVSAVVTAIINAIKTVENYVLTKNQVCFGMNLSLLIFYDEPVYRGQSKTKIEDTKVYDFVYNAVYNEIYKFVKVDKSIFNYLKTIATSQVDALKDIKDAEKKIRTRAKSSLLPSKLSVAYGASIDEREIFIVEGKSAAGTVNMARDSKFQEVLPLKGKISNAMRTSRVDVLKSEETADLFVSIGGIESDETNLRTKNVFIMTDSDPDGAHIVSLILALFYTLYPSFIKKYNLYAIEPPLFSAILGDKRAYGKTITEARTNFKAKFKKGAPTIYRNKGLGEMNPEEMVDVISPATRSVTKIEISANSENTMVELMSNNGSLRRLFIEDMK